MDWVAVTTAVAGVVALPILYATYRYAKKGTNEGRTARTALGTAIASRCQR